MDLVMLSSTQTYDTGKSDNKCQFNENISLIPKEETDHITLTTFIIMYLTITD